MRLYQTKLLEKLQESLGAVLPIIGIVLLLCFTIAPVPPGILMAFIIGAVLLIVGMMFFTLGAEIAMTPMGERIGTKMTQTSHVGIVAFFCFVLGFIITVSEPDLQVLAEQVPAVPNYTLIFAVAAGVGLFLVAAMVAMTPLIGMEALGAVYSIRDRKTEAVDEVPVEASVIPLEELGDYDIIEPQRGKGYESGWKPLRRCSVFL